MPKTRMIDPPRRRPAMKPAPLALLAYEPPACSLLATDRTHPHVALILAVPPPALSAALCTRTAAQRRLGHSIPFLAPGPPGTCPVTRPPDPTLKIYEFIKLVTKSTMTLMSNLVFIGFVSCSCVWIVVLHVCALAYLRADCCLVQLRSCP